MPTPSSSTEEGGFLSKLSSWFSSDSSGSSGNARFYHAPGMTGIMVAQREQEQKEKAATNVDRQ